VFSHWPVYPIGELLVTIFVKSRKIKTCGVKIHIRVRVKTAAKEP